MDQLINFGMVLRKHDPIGFDFVEQAAASSIVGDQHPLPITDASRIDMLIGGRVLQDCVNMHPAFVGKRGISDIGLMLIGHEIGNFRHKPGHILEMAQGIGQGLAFHFQREIRNNGTEVGISTTFPDAIDGPLYLLNAHLDRHQRVRHGHFTVVMGMDAKRYPTLTLHHSADLTDLPRHRAPVGITENHSLRTRLYRFPDRAQRIVRVGLIAVEEMLRIVENAASFPTEVADGIADQLKILVEGDTERIGDMERPGLSEERDDLRVGAK